MKSREDYLLQNKHDLVKNLDCYLEGIKDEQVMVVKTTYSLDKAKEDIKDFIINKKAHNLYVAKKTKKDLIKQVDSPTIHKEYFIVMGSLFHINSVEFSYSYYLNGNLVKMSPSIYNANIDIDVFDCLFDGGYSFSFDGKKLMNTKYEEIPTTDIIEEFDKDFVSCKIGNDEFNYDQKYSMKVMNQKLKNKLKEEKGNSLGKARVINDIELYDKKYTYSECVFVVPFYVFNYDTGKEIITITYNAYNGEISEPIINNPLSQLKYAEPEGVEKPNFNILIFLITLCLGFGILYLLFYIYKKLKYNKKAVKTIPYKELKEII